MWEDATPKEPEKEPGSAPRRSRPGGHDYVLWVQLGICLVIVGVVLGARKLNLPMAASLRTAFDLAVSQPGPSFLQWDGDREFQKFTQETLAELRGAVQEVAGSLTQSTPETAGRAKRARPGGSVSSQESCYLPSFALSFPLPDRNVARTSGYGSRTNPIGGLEQEFHTGVDLGAAQGTPVLAAADGVVRIAQTHSSYGNYVRLLHEDGDETLYAHMQFLFVRPGQTVTRGEQLGTVGQTGNATGPHLHFEILHEGVRYDPTQALEEAG